MHDGTTARPAVLEKALQKARRVMRRMSLKTVCKSEWSAKSTDQDALTKRLNAGFLALRQSAGTFSRSKESRRI